MTKPSIERGGGAAWSPAHVQSGADFTAREHRLVQRQIECRAHELWLADGRAGNTLDHWLEAERQVISEFITGRLAATGPTQTHTNDTPAMSSWIVCRFEPLASMRPASQNNPVPGVNRHNAR